MSDTELWQAWRERGDAEAFTTLVDRYLDMVYATARRILGNSHDAEDVAQECFISLLRGRVTVQDPLGPWLHRVTRNRALDKIKGEQRRRDRERVFHDENPHVDESAIDDLLEHVDAAIDALPTDLRDAVIGRFLEGKTNQALGEAMGVGESTIRFRVNKGVEQIREALKKQGLIVTAAALGVFLETNLADAAPLVLRQTVTKVALATPVPASPQRWLSSPKALAGLVIGLALLLRAGYIGVSGEFRDLGGKAGRAEQQNATVTMTTHPIEAAGAMAAPKATPAAAPPAEIESTPVVTQEIPELDPEEPTSTVSGTIYDERGYPIAGAIVTVATKFGPYEFERMQVFSATTREDGTYTVEGIRHHMLLQGYSSNSAGLVTYEPPIPYGVVHTFVTAAGYQTKGEQHPVEPGSHKEGIDYTLEPGITMRGRVVWPDGRPVSNAGIGVRHFFAPSVGYGMPRLGLSATDEKGRFLLGLPREGTISLMVVASDGHQALFHALTASEGEIPILTMVPMATLRGTLTTGDGRPLKEAHVRVDGRIGLVENPDFANQVETRMEGEIGSAYNHGTYTDANGDFSFESLAAVPDAVLYIDAPGGYNTDAHKRLLSYHVGPLPSGQATELNIVLPGTEQVMQIAVYVVGEQSGQPLPFTRVNLLNTTTQQKVAMGTGFEAPYYPAERGLSEPGEYVVWPHYNNRGWGGERERYGQVLTWNPGNSHIMTFRIPDPFSLSVQVVDSMGIPLSDVSVESVGDNANIRTDKTDSEGKFSWDGFPPNLSAYFRVAKAGYITDETVAIVGEPMRSYAADTVVLQRTGGAEGRVVDAIGAPLANALLQVTYATDELTWHQRQEETNMVQGY
ncbi:MAG: sigma-70 family RNA polymerase sigma factor, partial [Candidatus Hydrogenedentes bacterium]|nr:sigma-70 family RNA polymerase sigma factor [Candidatus Hydrogenedentota bacterium]